MDDLDAVNLALLAFRLVVGLGLAFHGYAKVFRGGRLVGTARWFDSMGMRPGHIHARLAAGTEIGAGLLLAAGLLTPFAGAALVGLMVVAFWTVHKGSGFLVTGNGWEYNLVLGSVGVLLGTLGPGDYSLDNAFGVSDSIGDGLAGTPGLLISLVLGVAAGVGLLATAYRPPAEGA